MKRVRPFIVTGGRTRPEHRDLRFETILRRSGVEQATDLVPEKTDILRACNSPLSVAEVGARLGLVYGVVVVLAGDLIAAGLLEVHQTDPVEIELDALTRMLERVRSL